jgi:hypothetical protein
MTQNEEPSRAIRHPGQYLEEMKLHNLFALFSESVDIVMPVVAGLTIGSGVLLILWDLAIVVFRKSFPPVRSAPPNSHTGRRSSNLPRPH